MDPPEPARAERDTPSADGREVGIGLAAVLGLVGSGATALLSIARSKVTAVLLGPVGVGMTAEITQIITMVTAPVSIASGPALIGGIAEARARGDASAVTRAYHSATTATILGAILGGALAVVLGLFLLPQPWGPSAWPWTLLGAIGAVGVAWASLPTQALMALGELRRLTLITLAGAAISTVFIVIGTWLYGLTGQFLAIAAAGIVSVPVAVALASGRLGAVGARGSWALDRGYVRRAIRVGSASLLAAVTSQAMLFTIRWTLEKHGGPALNGQFQAAWAIGAAYFGLVLSSLGNFAFPRFAAAADKEALTRELDQTLRFLFRVTPPLIMLTIAFRREIVELLYSHRFDPAIDLMGIQMTGDFAKAVSWAHAGPLLYRGRVRAFLCTEVGGAGLMMATVVPLVSRQGLDGVGYAYLITYSVYAVLTAVVLRVDSGVPLRSRYLLGTALVTGMLVATLELERRLPWMRWAAAAAAVVWMQWAGVLAELRVGIVRRLNQLPRRRTRTGKP